MRRDIKGSCAGERSPRNMLPARSGFHRTPTPMMSRCAAFLMPHSASQGGAVSLSNPCKAMRGFACMSSVAGHHWILLRWWLCMYLPASVSAGAMPIRECNRRTRPLLFACKSCSYSADSLRYGDPDWCDAHTCMDTVHGMQAEYTDGILTIILMRDPVSLPPAACIWCIVLVL